MTRHSKNLASASFLASIIVLAACVGDTGGGSGSKPGGSIEISNLEISGNEYINATAVFIARVDTNGAPVAESVLPDQKVDTCTEFAEPTPTPLIEPIIETKDVGGIVSLDTATAGEIRLVRETSGDDIYYNPDDVIDGVAMGKAYDVSLGGGGSEVVETTWPGAFKMPMQLSFDGLGAEGVFEIPNSGTMELTWDATGADLIALVIYGAETDKLATCILADDGEFTIPAGLIADLDEYGSVSAQAILEEHKILDGRRVNLVGRSGFSMQYQLVEAPTPTPTPTGTSTPTPTPTPSGSWSGSDSPAVPTVDNGSVCDSLTASGSGSAADVQIDISITHSYPLAVRATLEHNGVIADVFAAGAYDTSPITITALPVAGFTGSPTGTWTLCVIDVDAYNDTGTLNSWAVHN